MSKITAKEKIAAVNRLLKTFKVPYRIKVPNMAYIAKLREMVRKEVRESRVKPTAESAYRRMLIEQARTLKKKDS